MALQVKDLPIDVTKGGKSSYDTIFAKSFSRYEQKKFGYGALVGCFIITFSFFTILKPHLSSLPILNLKPSMIPALPMLVKEDTSNSQQMATTKISVLEGVADRKVKQEIIKPICNILDPRSDSCEVKGEIRIHGNSSTIFAVSSQMNSLEGNGSWAIRPYARKGDNIAMTHVRELSVKTFGREGAPRCTVNHSVPAIVFSIGGYSGNYFHDFSDVLIPLFVTSHQFNGEVQFLITDLRSYWIDKYQTILKQLSRFDVIDIDRDHDSVHCFPHVIMGLKASKEFSIDPSKSPNGYSMTDFGQFLRRTYSLKKATAIKISDHIDRKPRLLIISRKKSRLLANEGEVAEMARSLGYEVVVDEAMPDVSKFAPVVNSFDVLMGVHGAGLTNLAFLPAKAIVIQIVPLGLDRLAMDDFGKPSMDLNLRYLEYKIKKEESSLLQQYPINHAVFGDSGSIKNQGWLHFRSIYLDKQDVKLDVNRFRSTLLEALELLNH
ncbi:alpha-1,3-arabinosyltransferase XAT3-like [Macadamia integrifolia]|uniref:alpha-1,3-arabinosyltransferase XAT3-like n=1 Tax=Macadamia integrifolia TaxID=60698 RepID=UPI001C4F5E19|nr:alpha-1,3-arabinosyltransferase XAT3-like [Macadamia integrifolia]